MAFFRSDQAAIHVTVDGITIDDTVWDTFDGGDNTADTTNYKPGGMAPSLELGGIPTRSDVTITRIWSDVLIGAYKQLDNAVGRATATISTTPLNVDGSTTGQVPVTYTGILKSVVRPNYDSSSSAEAKLTLVFGLNGNIS